MDYRNESLADRVFNKLEDDIIHGVIPIGEVVTELKLAEMLNVSRTPIREACRRLELESLLKDIGRGYLVLGITEADLVDIMDIRILLEPIAAYHTVKNITEDGINKLRSILDLQEFYLSKQDMDRLRQEDDVFHDVICQLSGRAVFTETLLPLHRKTRRYRRLSIEDYNRRNLSLEEHTKIFNAIASGDAELARDLTAEHIKKAKINMMERLGYHG